MQKEAYARRGSQAGRDRRASYGAQAAAYKGDRERVIESGRCSGLKGRTPEATIAATLAVGSKPGGPFQRVDKGTNVCVVVVEELSGGGDRGVGALGSVVCEQDRHGWFLAAGASGACSAS